MVTTFLFMINAGNRAGDVVTVNFFDDLLNTPNY